MTTTGEVGELRRIGEWIEGDALAESLELVDSTMVRSTAIMARMGPRRVEVSPA